MTTRGKTQTVYRDSIDGHFITKGEALKRPQTTEKQNLKPPQPVRGLVPEVSKK